MERLKATGLSLPAGLGISCLFQFWQPKKYERLWGRVRHSFHFGTAEWLRKVLYILTMNSMQHLYVKSREYNH